MTFASPLGPHAGGRRCWRHLAHPGHSGTGTWKQANLAAAEPGSFLSLTTDPAGAGQGTLLFRSQDPINLVTLPLPAPLSGLKSSLPVLRKLRASDERYVTLRVRDSLRPTWMLLVLCACTDACPTHDGLQSQGPTLPPS